MLGSRCSEGRTESDDKSLVCYYSIKASYRIFSGLGRLKNVLTCLGLNIKYWTSPDLNAMRWLRLFTNTTSRKNRKLIFLHGDFIICIVSLEIHVSIRILSSAFFYSPPAIRHPPSATRRNPVHTLQRPTRNSPANLNTMLEK